MYNIIISKKREPVKGKMRVLITVMQNGAKYLCFHTKQQKNQNIVDCNLRSSTG